MSEANPPDNDPFVALRHTVNTMEFPEVPKRYEKLTVFFFFFHLSGFLFCLLYPYSDGQPNWLGMFINALFMFLQMFRLYMRWTSTGQLQRLVNHGKALKKAINTPIYLHDPENGNITITFIQVMSPAQVDDIKRKIKHARSQRSRRV